MKSKAKRFVQLTVTALGAAGISALTLVAPAGAAPAPAGESAGQQQELRQGMYVAGFNEEVAKANGYKIVTYPNGDRQSVPADPDSKLPKSPILSHTANTDAAPANSDYDRVQGNCGSSWIAVRQTGPSNVQVGSGFSVYTGTVSHSWTVALSDANGTSHQSGPSRPTNGTWAWTWSNLYQRSYTFDHVSSGVAQLVDGVVCYAGRPSVSISGL
ncbi:hypothetical protein AB5J62_05665 [Amycolatopsis sp. cg5]|uniref:hypothetical protein n=1 Tax=Amycolatopsis sp. cg5 TaxID=3238802 RepID=UPI0035238E75